MTEALDILHTYITTHQPKRTVYHGGISDEERVKFEQDLESSLNSINSESIEHFRDWISPNGIIHNPTRPKTPIPTIGAFEVDFKFEVHRDPAPEPQHDLKLELCHEPMPVLNPHGGFEDDLKFELLNDNSQHNY